MKKMLLLAMLILGLTFVYDTSSREGFIFFNQADGHAVIFMDSATNTLYFYELRFHSTKMVDAASLRTLLQSFGHRIAIITPPPIYRGREF